MTLRILLADNDVEFLQTRATLLRRAGCTVLEAGSLDEARRVMDERWFHVAILDMRLEDDHDLDDISGIELAREPRYQPIPKIIATAYPNWEAARAALGSRLDGPSPADDFLDKKEGFDALRDAIYRVANKRLGFNWALVTHWGRPGHSYPALAGQLDPALDTALWVERSEELEDLMRILFARCSQITIDRVLWQEPGRAALVVLAFYEDAPARQLLLTCGQPALIRREVDNLSRLANMDVLTGNPHRSGHQSTRHYAANTYELPNSDLETIKTFADLYRQDNTRAINDALQTLVQTSLSFWHSQRQIKTAEESNALIRQRFNLDQLETVAADLAARLESIGRDAKAAGLASFERPAGALRIHQPDGIDYTGPDPVAWLARSEAGLLRSPTYFGPTLGELRAETLLIDSTGRTWPTDFGHLAEGPILADYAALETSFKFELAESESLTDRLESEQLLMAARRLDDRIDSEPPSLRKAMTVIQRVRSLAEDVCGDEFEPYLLALAYQAIRRVLAYETAIKRARRDIVPAVHACLSLGVILERLAQLDAARGRPTNARPTGLDVDEVNRQVTVDGHVAELSTLEFSVVHYLWRNAGQLCSRADLFQAVYGRRYEQGRAASDDAQLNMLIKRVREEIEDDPAAFRYLFTRRGLGFELHPQGKNRLE